MVFKQQYAPRTKRQHDKLRGHRSREVHLNVEDETTP